MRKRICSRCGKFAIEGQQCICTKTTSRINQVKKNKSKERDLIHSTAWREKREKIIKRDNFMCMRCLIKYNLVNTSELTVHHILSRKNHPELVFEDLNLMCLCATCNKQLGTKDKLDFEWDAEEHNKRLEIKL